MTKKKLISAVLAMLGLGLIGIAVLAFLGIFRDQISGILIESDPEAVVYINNEEVGKTPYEQNRKAEEITIRIKPISTEGVILDDFETKLSLVPGIKTIIKRSFKESEDDSSGAIVSFEKLGGDESFVTVISIPDNSQVLIDGKVQGYTPLRVKVPAGDHTLIVSSEKYLEKSLPIRVYKGYKLTASVKLAKIKENTVQELAVLAEETVRLGRIRINKTDLGYLRVRSGANIGFPEIGQVKPDEEYEILEEGEHVSWYKIQLPDEEGQESGRQGWVSAEFVTKL